MRTKEHKRNTRFQQVNASAVAAHAILEGHTIDWMRPQILDRSMRTQHRKTKEALWIANYDEKNLLNQDVGRELSPLWLELLSQTRIKKQNAYTSCHQYGQICHAVFFLFFILFYFLFWYAVHQPQPNLRSCLVILTSTLISRLNLRRIHIRDTQDTHA